MTRADVIIPVYRDLAITQDCIESVVAHSGQELGSIIIIDDCGPEAGMRPMLRALRDRHDSIRLIENERNLGFVRSCNRGLSLRSHDAVLLNSDTRVTKGWLTELLKVRGAHERIGAVCPLSNNATLCSVPEFGRPTPSSEIDSAALELSRLPAWTEVPTGVGFCILMRSDLLDLAGLLDPVYGRGYNEENDWCQRIQSLGFMVARANHAFVYHLGQVSFGDERNELDILNARRLNQRYPHYLEQTRAFEAGPTARVGAIAARRSLSRLRVCVDLSHVIAPRIHGTAAYGTSLVESLAALNEVDLSVRVANAAMAAHFEERGVARATLGATPDLEHYPTQLYDRESAARALAGAAHLVLTWQDLIAYRVPGALQHWERVETFRALTWACLQAAQGIIAISKSARDDLVSSFGLPTDAIDVVPLGVTAPQVIDAARVRASHRLQRPYFLALGSDFPHKNLRFAIEAWSLLRARMGEATPDLVFAGPPSHVHGALGLAPPRLEGVRFLGELPPEQVGAVLAGATALSFCSTYEGFGLPILEAMALDVPVVALPLSAVPEVAGDAALIAPDLSVAAFARCLEQVCQPGVREGLIARGRENLRHYEWAATAARTLEVYDRVAAAPRNSTLAARQALARLLAEPTRTSFGRGQSLTGNPHHG